MIFALGLGSSALTTGCLVADAPEYGPPQQRAAVIQWEQVAPSPYEMYVFEQDTTTMAIDVPLRSEDAGDRLVGSLWVDWEARDRTPQFIWDIPLPPSSFDKLDRSWEYSFRPDSRVQRQCGHTLTLLLLHESNYDSLEKVPLEGATWDLASVTWQINVFPRDAGVVEPCPRPPGNSTPTGSPSP